MRFECRPGCRAAGTGFADRTGGSDATTGRKRSDLAAARALAAAAAREIAAESVRTGEPLKVWLFEVCDEAGQLLATVPVPGVPGPH